MSNETKWNVFEDAVNELEDVLPDTALFGNEYIADLVGELRARYAAALPDDLPVIPKAVSDYISKAKKPRQWGLLDVFWHLGDNISAVGINGLYDFQRWMVDNQVAVARAWVLGVWRVEGTDEIVKVEEEK